MNGYYTANGYYDYVDGHYCYFASKSDYYLEIESGYRRCPEFESYESLLDEHWD